MPNTFTIVGGWNSNTISLYLNTYLSCLFLYYHPSRQGFERYCISCRKQNDKPTIPSTLTIVGSALGGIQTCDTLQSRQVLYQSSCIIPPAYHVPRMECGAGWERGLVRPMVLWHWAWVWGVAVIRNMDLLWPPLSSERERERERGGEVVQWHLWIKDTSLQRTLGSAPY